MKRISRRTLPPVSTSFSTSVPVISAGSRSGVNWTRPKLRPSACGYAGDEQRLGKPGHANQQRVPARQQGDEHGVDHFVLPDHDLGHLLLEPARGLGAPLEQLDIARWRRRRGGSRETHVISRCSGLAAATERPGRGGGCRRAAQLSTHGIDAIKPGSARRLLQTRGPDPGPGAVAVAGTRPGVYPDATMGHGPEAGDAGASAPAPRIIVERPPPGLARGRYAWPAWGIGLVGGTVVLLGLVWMVWRLGRSGRNR